MKNSKLFEEVPIGTILFGVHSNIYEEHGLPYEEIIVSTEEVKAHLSYGYNEVRTSDGATPYYYKASDFGQKVFFTAKEAAQEALERTIRHDQIWTQYGEPPMRRTWEHYLQEGKE